MKRIWTVLAVLALGSSAFAQKEIDLRKLEEVKTSMMKAKIDAELAALKGDLAAAQYGVAGPTVTGAPYSAEAVTESVQVLGDGNAIRKRTVVRVYRDSAGRTARQEADSSGEFHTITIFDPVANVTHFLDPQRRAVSTRSLAATKKIVGDIADLEKREIEKKMAAAAAESRAEMKAIKLPLKAQPENLPPQTMEGLKVEGTRVTNLIAAGEIGNDLPIETYSERWYSPDLKVVIMTRRHDPRTGDVTYQLQRVQRAEPAAHIFQVPPGFTPEPEKPIVKKVAIQ